VKIPTSLILLLISILVWLRIIRKPDFTCVVVEEGPLDEEMSPGILYSEVRNGYRKWSHLTCPRCGDHIELEAGDGRVKWSLAVDWLRRPTLKPSIWERSTCGAHFFIRKGTIVWCRD
jgi:hypothetical protein